MSQKKARGPDIANLQDFADDDDDDGDDSPAILVASNSVLLSCLTDLVQESKPKLKKLTCCATFAISGIRRRCV